MQVINPSNSVDFQFEVRLDFDEDPLDCLAVKQQQQQQQQVDCLAHNFVADQSGLGFLLFQKLFESTFEEEEVVANFLFQAAAFLSLRTKSKFNRNSSQQADGKIF